KRQTATLHTNTRRLIDILLTVYTDTDTCELPLSYRSHKQNATKHFSEIALWRFQYSLYRHQTTPTLIE
ncbi:MAG TPA: hypothetical protein DCE42_12690, partial [Myxococcales bacterium]|nr:hypothetical protein [Myxococcales bacterium]